MSFWKTPVLLASHGEERWDPLPQPDWWLSNADFCHQLMYGDLTGYLPDDLLVKLDRAAMAVSLETRVPFLDRKLMEFAWRIPLAMKLDQGRRKWILRRVLYRYLPPELVDRPKQGFSVPLLKWLMGPLRDWAEALLDERRLRQDGYFDTPVLRDNWANVANHHHRLKHGIWSVLMFQAWLDACASESSMRTPVSLR
jgi:asparagine synthase (glutamine-hydrolysing)